MATLINPPAVANNDVVIARLAALSVCLALWENSIPTPLPGVKFGLANIMTLFVFARWGWYVAAWVNGLRVVVIGLLSGQLFGPGFCLSVAGASASLLGLGIIATMGRSAVVSAWVSRYVGWVSLSMVLALTHTFAQLLLVRCWLIRHDGLWAIAPAYALAAMVFGAINGLAVAWLLKESLALSVNR